VNAFSDYRACRGTLNGACEEALCPEPRREKRLKIETVIHCARKCVQEGKKTEGIDMIVRGAHYTVAEAEKLADFIAYFSISSSIATSLTLGVMSIELQDFSAESSTLKKKRMMDFLLLRGRQIESKINDDDLNRSSAETRRPDVNEEESSLPYLP
jgi:hypothetical protein